MDDSVKMAGQKLFPEIKLDTSSPLQLHFQIAEQIKEVIEKNRMPAGITMASVRMIAEKFKTSRPTVQKAFELLSKSGVLEKSAGSNRFKVSKKIKDLYRRPAPVLGIILPYAFSEFLSKASPASMRYFAGVVDRVEELNYSLMIIGIPPVEVNDAKLIEWQEHLVSRLNGIVNFGIRRVENDRVFAKILETSQIPHVFIDGYSETLPHISSAYADPKPGAIAAAQLLCEKGHTEIGTIAVVPKSKAGDDIKFHWERRASIVRDIFQNSGLKLPGIWQVACRLDKREIERAVKKMFSGDRVPTALWCHNDFVAKIALSVLSEMGLVVPRDVSLVGYDDSSDATECNPPLTTIRHPNYLIGKLAVDLAHQLFENGRAGDAKCASVPTSLVVRESLDFTRKRQVRR